MIELGLALLVQAVDRKIELRSNVERRTGSIENLKCARHARLRFEKCLKHG